MKCLTGWILGELAAMRHGNDRPVLHIYGPLDTEMRGGTVTMNFYDPDCRFFDHRAIETAANLSRISLRTGCFCNPGGGELSLGISESDLTTCFAQPQKRLTLDDFRHCIDGKSTGAVRISFGIASNFTDAYRFVEFAKNVHRQARGALMEIRPYNDDDLAAVLGLWRAVFPNAPAHNAPEDVIARKLEVQRQLFVVATEGGEIIGTAMGGYDGHRGWVYSVAVSPDRRRQGIGTALMRRVERDLEGLGCPKLNLQVRGTNRQAVGFYKSLGYETEDRVSMGKKLEGE